jgi:hypothetical protein
MLCLESTAFLIELGILLLVLHLAPHLILALVDF